MKTSHRLFYFIMSVKPRILSWAYGLLFSLTVFAQQSTLFFKVDTPIVHDPVLAYDKGLYHLYSTGEGIRHYVSLDLKDGRVVSFKLFLHGFTTLSPNLSMTFGLPMSLSSEVGGI